MDERKGSGMINPISVSLGLFLAVGGWILGCVLSSYVDEVRDRNKTRREWEEQTRKGGEYE